MHIIVSKERSMQFGKTPHITYIVVDVGKYGQHHPHPFRVCFGVTSNHGRITPDRIVQLQKMKRPKKVFWLNISAGSLVACDMGPQQKTNVGRATKETAERFVVVNSILVPMA
jgi:hypothetical protein